MRRNRWNEDKTFVPVMVFGGTMVVLQILMIVFKIVTNI